MCPEKNQWHQFIIPKLKNENLESTIFIGWPLNLSPSIAMVTGKMDNGLFEAAAVKSPFLKNLVAGFALCDGHVRQHIPEVLVL